ncbi:hypothetical protein HDU76_010389 [Blyttiomyces sp. JEL0837]|nr:hypothetical protein HDU76_010389 [Blyttiomyces sp. JEL0837]
MSSDPTSLQSDRTTGTIEKRKIGKGGNRQGNAGSAGERVKSGGFRFGSFDNFWDKVMPWGKFRKDSVSSDASSITKRNIYEAAVSSGSLSSSLSQSGMIFLEADGFPGIISSAEYDEGVGRATGQILVDKQLTHPPTESESTLRTPLEELRSSQSFNDIQTESTTSIYTSHSNLRTNSDGSGRPARLRNAGSLDFQKFGPVEASIVVDGTTSISLDIHSDCTELGCCAEAHLPKPIAVQMGCDCPTSSKSSKCRCRNGSAASSYDSLKKVPKNHNLTRSCPSVAASGTLAPSHIGLQESSITLVGSTSSFGNVCSLGQASFQNQVNIDTNTSRRNGGSSASLRKRSATEQKNLQQELLSFSLVRRQKPRPPLAPASSNPLLKVPDTLSTTTPHSTSVISLKVTPPSMGKSAEGSASHLVYHSQPLTVGEVQIADIDGQNDFELNSSSRNSSGKTATSEKHLLSVLANRRSKSVEFGNPKDKSIVSMDVSSTPGDLEMGAWMSQDTAYPTSSSTPTLTPTPSSGLKAPAALAKSFSASSGMSHTSVSSPLSQYCTSANSTCSSGNVSSGSSEGRMPRSLTQPSRLSTALGGSNRVAVAESKTLKAPPGSALYASSPSLGFSGPRSDKRSTNNANNTDRNSGKSSQKSTGTHSRKSSHGHHHHHHHYHQTRSQHTVIETSEIYDKMETVPRNFTITTPAGLVEEVQGTLNQYHILSDIARGSFGKVLLCRDRTTWKYYACKVVSKARLMKNVRKGLARKKGPLLLPMPPGIGGGEGGSLNGPGRGPPGRECVNLLWGHGPQHPTTPAVEDPDPLHAVKREIAILKKLSKHPNINCLVEVLDDAKEDNLYMMHHKGIVHRDLKPENILVTAQRTVQIADFGISHECDGDNDLLDDKNATLMFSPPEAWQDNQQLHGKAADIWSLGVTLYALTHGYLPFDESSILELNEKIVNSEPEILAKLSDPLRDLLRRMLTKDPDDRISIAQIREHSWVTLGGQEPLLSTEENCVFEEVTEEEVEKAFSPVTMFFTKIKMTLQRLRTKSKTREASTKSRAASTSPIIVVPAANSELRLPTSPPTPLPPSPAMPSFRRPFTAPFLSLPAQSSPIPPSASEYGGYSHDNFDAYHHQQQPPQQSLSSSTLYTNLIQIPMQRSRSSHGMQMLSTSPPHPNHTGASISILSPSPPLPLPSTPMLSSFAPNPPTPISNAMMMTTADLPPRHPSSIASSTSSSLADMSHQLRSLSIPGSVMEVNGNIIGGGGGGGCGGSSINGKVNSSSGASVGGGNGFGGGSSCASSTMMGMINDVAGQSSSSGSSTSQQRPATPTYVPYTHARGVGSITTDSNYTYSTSYSNSYTTSTSATINSTVPQGITARTTPLSFASMMNVMGRGGWGTPPRSNRASSSSLLNSVHEFTAAEEAALSELMAGSEQIVSGTETFLLK